MEIYTFDQYRISNQFNYVCYHSKEKGYILDIGGIGLGVSFRFFVDKKGVIVTSRDLIDYEKSFGCLEFDSKKKYCEIGAGLGNLVPYMVSLGIKPTVIDLADYQCMRSILTDVLGDKNLKINFKQKIIPMIDRIDIYLGSNVNLINKSLGRALDENPELIGQFDVVIDHFGAKRYNFIEKGEIVEQLEEKLVKEGGVLINYSI